MTTTNLNTLQAGDPSEYAFNDPMFQRTMDDEQAAHEKALELGFFDLVAPHFNDVDLNKLDDLTVSAPEKIREQVTVVNICGLVSSTPLPIDVPDNCRFMKVETSGRVWFSASGQSPIGTQTLDQAQQYRSIAIVGNGVPKIIPKPLGLKTVYVSAYPDNSEVSISFIGGTLVYKDIV